MDADLVARINRAVDDCLNACTGSGGNVRRRLGEFCDRLGKNAEWSREEVELIRSIALRVVAEREGGRA